MPTKLETFRSEVMKELLLGATQNPATKDILVVVHDQLDYVRPCLESVISCTNNYRLMVFDNGSAPPTRTYLQGLADRGQIDCVFAPTNQGFIIPNNLMAAQSQADYMILLNSDCEVRQGWDLAMVNYLEANPRVAQVGYAGGLLGADAVGGTPAFGSEADYIVGWCFCIHRETYDQFGLFDGDHLEFAYGEDSDLSLRLRECGCRIYALHTDLVIHHGSKTVVQVRAEKGDLLRETFERNHDYLRRRWSRYLGRTPRPTRSLAIW